MATAAHAVSAPVLYHVQWDDEIFPRDGQFEVFDALASADKQLIARPGPHEHTHPGAEVHPHEHQHHETVKKGVLITGAMTIHRLPEGFAIGAGFASGSLHSLGWVLA